MAQPLHLKAYGKVNLGLDVIRRREDGYHEVRMIMQTVKLYDRIILERNHSGNISLRTNLPYLPVNEKNLVYRAIDIIRREYGHFQGRGQRKYHKTNPCSRRNGGRNTDAAAAFVGINQLFSLNITQEKLMEYGRLPWGRYSLLHHAGNGALRRHRGDSHPSASGSRLLVSHS